MSKLFMPARLFAACALAMSLPASQAWADTAPVVVKPTPAAEAAVDRLIAAAGMVQQFENSLPKIIDMVLPTFLQGNDDRQQELRKIVGDEFLTTFRKATPLFIAKTRELYLQKFTERELDQLAAFMESPIGRKNAKVGSEIQMEMLAYGQQFGRAAAEEALPRIIDRMRAGNFRLPQGT